MAYAPLVDHEVVDVYYETVNVEGHDVEVVYEGSGGTSISVWKLTDKYGLFKTYEVEGITVLGLPGAVVVRDPDTVSGDDPIGKPVGPPVEKLVAGESDVPVGYIMPPDQGVGYHYGEYLRDGVQL
ncbi:MAG: hypothetical protein JRC60_07425 [Deltaproteobacteria bacterium]|nr:hypothetical protein [Deltaproteobacteria bacterium]